MKRDEDPKIENAKAKLRRVAAVTWAQKQRVCMKNQIQQLNTCLDGKKPG